MHIATVQQPLTTMSPNWNPAIVMLQAEAVFVSQHNVAFHSVVQVHRSSRHWRCKRPWFPVKGRIKRCFNCRSRGDLGDCKDPFPHNATTVEELRAVEALPCASGWCAKIVEGKGDATERMCLQRPPGDEEQRCAPTLFQGRRVMMCFCRGDLCNSAITMQANSIYVLCSILGIIIFKFWL
ncbi:uncharacterized protein TNCV_580201 [Trichonephila clavipes]|nr:uncharacterized protein TNCV_580201 [Trichonephila clavipes]